MTMGREEGFSLVEVLIVTLIIAILAAIAIPAFLSQEKKAQDSAAKSMSRSAASAALAYSNGGDAAGFTGMTIPDLRGIEPSLNDAGGVAAVTEIVGTPGAETFTVTTKSKSGKYFTLTRDSGRTTRCSGATAPSGACAASDW